MTLPITIGISGTGYVAWRYGIKPLVPKPLKTLFSMSEVLEGKNIEKHSKDAPKPLKKLYSALVEALDSPDQMECHQTARDALANFFSHPQHDKMLRKSILSDLSSLYDKLHNDEERIQSHLEKCCNNLRECIAKQQGLIAQMRTLMSRIANPSKSTTNGSPLATTHHTYEGTIHSVERLRYLLRQSRSERRTRLMQFHLKKLKLEAHPCDPNLSDILTQFVKDQITQIKTTDPVGYLAIADNKKTPDELFIAYESHRELHPILTSQTHLPKPLQWKQETSYDKEKAKTIELMASLGTLVLFSRHYGSHQETKDRFYKTLSETYHSTSEERKKALLLCFKKERERLGGSFIPWKIEEAVLSSAFSFADNGISQFIAETPAFENIQKKLKDSLIPSMAYLGEKSSRFFHYLTRKYDEWSKNYTYDCDFDDFLESKLQSRQENALGKMDLNFFLSQFSLVSSVNDLLKEYSEAAITPVFKSDSYLRVFNLPFLFFKHLVVLPFVMIAQILKLPFSIVQKVLDFFYETAVEQVLVNTSLLDSVEEALAEALLDTSPCQFPLLEVLLENLQEILSIIETKPREPFDPHPQKDQAKRALQEAIRTFVVFAKTQESLDTTNNSQEQAIFETVLPYAVDKIFETTLKVHRIFKEKDDFKEKGAEFLQALNFYICNKQKDQKIGEEEKKRHDEIKKLIGNYTINIAKALLNRTFFEELPDNIASFLNDFLLKPSNTNLSQMTQDYLDRKKGLFADLLTKSHVMKGLFLFLIKQDK